MEDTRTTRWMWIILGGLAVLGSALRFYQLHYQIIADDEWHAIHQVLNGGFASIATSFGRADHGIPLTLFYELLSRTTGLEEWGMRLPLLAAGIASIVVIPWLLRFAASRPAALIMAGLLAISPIHVYFSRTARPYALTMLTTAVALVAFWHWWRRGDRRWAITYVVAAAASCYSHLITAPFVTAPLLYAGCAALGPASQRDFAPLWRVVKLGIALALPLLVLLGPPLVADFASLSTKAGRSLPGWDTAYRASSLLFGSASIPFLTASGLLTIIGAVASWRTFPAWTGLVLFTMALHLTSILVLQPNWVQHALVLARYCLPFLPFMLLWAAGGIVTVAGLAPTGWRVAVAGLLGVGVILAAILSGPLSGQYGHVNQFTGHMRYQADYADAYNPYMVITPKRIPAFYQELGKLPEASRTIIEAPWRFEWHNNPLVFYQAVHGQVVRIGFVSGLCGHVARGEYPVDAPGMAFRHFVHLSDVLRADDPPADFVVFHREPLWTHEEPPPDIDQCIERYAQRFGEPAYEDRDITVFKLRGNG